MISSQKDSPNESRDITNTAFTPISRLPPELLYHIFRFSLDISPTYCTQIFRLRLVCQRWNRIVETSPALWSFLISMRSRQIEYFLNRSKSHPLTVQYTRGSNMWRLGDDITHVHRVCELIPRWSHAIIHVQRLSSVLDRHLSAPAPLLESFSLEVSEPRHSRESVDLFSEHAPRLREVVLKGLTVKWNSPIFHSLHSLTIGWNVLDTNRLLSMLSACPMLETLRLERVALSGAFKQNISGDVIVHQLRELHIRNASWTSTANLLSRLRLPICTGFVYEPVQFTGRATFAEFLYCVLNAVPTLFQDRQPVHIRHIPDEYVQISSGEHNCIAGLYTSCSITKILRSVVTNLDYPRLSIDTHDRVEVLELTKTRDVLEGIEGVYALTLHTATATAELDAPANMFIRRLWVPEAGGAYTDWPLPNLECLTLVNKGFDMLGLINMVKHRYFSKPCREAAPVLPLQELNFQACSVIDTEKDELAYYMRPGKVTISP